MINSRSIPDSGVLVERRALRSPQLF